MTNKINEQGLSKDYQRLLELIKTQSIICVVDFASNKFKECRDVGFLRPCNDTGLFTNKQYIARFNGGIIICSFTEQSFITECNRLNLAYYDPTPKDGWLPIETAPRDGTIILLNNRGEVCSGLYSKLDDDYPWVVFDGTREHEDTIQADYLNGWKQTGKYAPTHWQPLPTPPQKEDEEDGYCTR